MQQKEVFYYGQPIKDPELVSLRAGNLSLAYQSGNLRYIGLGGYEVLRMVYPAVRDHNWGTLPYTIQNEIINTSPSSFDISFTTVYGSPAVFKAFYTLKGTPGGTIGFTMDGEVLADYNTNRIGFCILHPIETCIGRSCVVTMVDGKQYSAVFPEQIAPHQPFNNIRQMDWVIQDTIAASLKLEGDIFETEDQRNWTDASFKTYSRPLEMPFPYKVRKGETIQQKVTLHVSGYQGNYPSNKPGLQFRLSTFRLDMPQIGISKSSRSAILGPEESEVIGGIPFSHYRVEVRFTDPAWPQYLDEAIREAIQLHFRLELVLFFTDEAENEAMLLLQQLKPAEKHIRSVLILDEATRLTVIRRFPLIYNLLKKYCAGIETGAGTDANFAELNRSDIANIHPDFVSFAICPQVHAFDNLSLVENLAAQKYAIKSCKNIFGTTPVHISPVTLRQRFNAVATSAETGNKPGGLPPQVDVRQLSLFAAAWTLGSIKNMAEAGATSVTYYETTGERGIIQGSEATAFPGLFLSKPGMIFPVWYVLNRIIGKDKKYTRSVSSNPLMFDGIVLEDGNFTEIILANYTSETITISIPDLPREYSIVTIDETNYESITSQLTDLDALMKPSLSEEISILPLAITCIRF